MTTGVVVILFNPDVEHVNALINAFTAPEWNIVLVDNSFERTQYSASRNVTYIHCSSNVGIAQAQNIGLKRLFDNDVEHAFLLDQDSLFSPDIAHELLRQFLQLEKEHSIAAIGPSIYCQFSECVDKGVLQKGKQVSNTLKEVKQIIASGMLISRYAFNKVGGKESTLFIDGVDHEWCWRARAKGMVIYQSLSACMPHRQGDDRVKVCGVTFKQGAPVRLYYQFRNVLILARRRYVPLYWKVRHVCAIPLRYIVNRYCFTQGKERGRFMREGIKDGFLHRTGPISVKDKGKQR
ncbi:MULTISPECIES: glycosyltransferase family 2 protein [Alteromonas]|mgnify:FL=1|uniref:Rhamnosyltransferase n=2 Tax=Alteromonas mediterranea TaxID=314275 RepID=S5AEV2_9ALTE|nr:MULTISPECIES: glycosyltransferase family 2 protein [Alteromonas]AGP77196.1 rhamnosyltransferase [Alteromonas mediterranea 615]AGP92705.1 rhamnosyltransferase [Alteromonas mediterranea U8]MDY6885099.1 glycosyltransferase family 2 protein [Pseudomonadota bacterium]AGP84706.1 rhamnosyltransferase [Alteromonas mediterranea U4]AGP88821.1 rhamnosyltransferase [Alteromonas mediterranea U7]